MLGQGSLWGRRNMPPLFTGPSSPPAGVSLAVGPPPPPAQAASKGAAAADAPPPPSRLRDSLRSHQALSFIVSLPAPAPESAPPLSSAPRRPAPLPRPGPRPTR